VCHTLRQLRLTLLLKEEVKTDASSWCGTENARPKVSREDAEKLTQRPAPNASRGMHIGTRGVLRSDAGDNALSTSTFLLLPIFGLTV
jgi:hypothetical protein